MRKLMLRTSRLSLEPVLRWSQAVRTMWAATRSAAARADAPDELRAIVRLYDQSQRPWRGTAAASF